MNSSTPIAILQRCRAVIVYFDLCSIKNSALITGAYLKMEREGNCEGANDVSVSLNKRLSEKERDYLEENLRVPKNCNGENTILIDVRKQILQILSGCIENKGLLVKSDEFLSNPNLIIEYAPEIIYPRGSDTFFEKEFNISLHRHEVQLPWIFTGLADTITIFVENQDSEKIIVQLENSPNAMNSVKDAQQLLVHPHQTADIVPYMFSKFTRVVIYSNNPVISCTVWFQAQLKK